MRPSNNEDVGQIADQFLASYHRMPRNMPTETVPAEQLHRIVADNLRYECERLGIEPTPYAIHARMLIDGIKGAVSQKTIKRHLETNPNEEQTMPNEQARQAYADLFGYSNPYSILGPNHQSLREDACDEPCFDIPTEAVTGIRPPQQSARQPKGNRTPVGRPKFTPGQIADIVADTPDEPIRSLMCEIIAQLHQFSKSLHQNDS